MSITFRRTGIKRSAFQKIKIEVVETPVGFIDVEGGLLLAIEVERKGYFVFCNDGAEERFCCAGSGIGVGVDDHGLLDVLHAGAAGALEEGH